MRLKTVALLCLLVAVGIVSHVEGFPTGAPLGACSTLSPNPFAHGADAQETTVPYEVDLSLLSDSTGALSYIPGENYTLTVKSISGAELFRGVLLQARLVADDTTPVGSFTVTDSDTRLSSCIPPETSLTHRTNVDKEFITTSWTAPSLGTGAVRIGFAVVMVRNMYWANQRTQVIAEGATLTSTTSPPTTPPPTTPPLTAPPPTTPPPTAPLPTTPPPTVPSPLTPTRSPLSQLPECGGGLRRLASPVGHIATLDWPNSPYPMNTDCVWDIVCPPGNIVRVDFDRNFRIAGEMPSCDRDRILISDCENETVHYGPFCYLTSPEPIRTVCNQIKVIFEARNVRGRTRTGFRMNYRCLQVPPPTASPTRFPSRVHSYRCGKALQIRTAPIGHIQTLNYRQPYPFNIDCNWTIRCPPTQIMIITFNKSFRVAGEMPTCAKDLFEISDCNGELTYGPFCHLTAPEPITTECNEVVVSFRTGEGRGFTRTGFRLKYECV